MTPFPQLVEPGPVAFAALESNARPLTAAGAEVIAVRAALVEPLDSPKPRSGVLTVYPR